MAMTIDGFKRRVRGLVDAGAPFVAYWHEHGFGFMYTNPQVIENQQLFDGFVKKHKAPTISAVKQFKKEIERERKKSWRPVYMVEFDGVNVSTDGGLEIEDLTL